MMDDTEQNHDLVAVTAELVSSYVASNQIAASELPELIRKVHGTLQELATGTPAAEAAPEPAPRPKPAVPISRSVTPDAIICLEDGKPFKTLKRHLKTVYNLSPDEYRARWGLPDDYPMVAPNYSAQRAATARRIGLGRKPSGN